MRVHHCWISCRAAFAPGEIGAPAPDRCRCLTFKLSKVPTPPGSRLERLIASDRLIPDHHHITRSPQHLLVPYGSPRRHGTGAPPHGPTALNAGQLVPDRSCTRHAAAWQCFCPRALHSCPCQCNVGASAEAEASRAAPGLNHLLEMRNEEVGRGNPQFDARRWRGRQASWPGRGGRGPCCRIFRTFFGF
jgi:hypothetical protein